MAFGKRVRIANAIAELRRPPSIEYSDDQLSPMQLHHSNSLNQSQSQFQSPSHSHSRTQSQSHSHHSLSGTAPVATVVHNHPYYVGGPGVVVGHGGQQQSGQMQDTLLNNNDGMRPAGMGNGAAFGITAAMSAATGVGLGIALSPTGAPSVEVNSFFCLV